MIGEPLLSFVVALAGIICWYRNGPPGKAHCVNQTMAEDSGVWPPPDAIA